MGVDCRREWAGVNAKGMKDDGGYGSWEARTCARIKARLGEGIGVLKESKRLIEVEHGDS